MLNKYIHGIAAIKEEKAINLPESEGEDMGDMGDVWEGKGSGEVI